MGSHSFQRVAVIGAVSGLGLAGILAGVAPAGAADSATCDAGGVPIGPAICEVTINGGSSATFTPTAEMTSLEALVVGGGGSGTVSDNGDYYAGGGSGGVVDLQGFDADPARPLEIAAGNAGVVSRVSQPGVPEVLAYAGPRGTNGTSGLGASVGNVENPRNGVTPAQLAAAGSPFADDTRCFGGGGAFVASTAVEASVPALCGAGAVSLSGAGSSIGVALANSGAGGGAVQAIAGRGSANGGSGVVILRWKQLRIVNVSFDLGGHGSAIEPRAIAIGGLSERPADPTAEGFTFEGWFTDSALTREADFSAPLTADRVYFAKWAPVAVEPTPTPTPTQPESTSTPTATPTQPGSTPTSTPSDPASVPPVAASPSAPDPGASTSAVPSPSAGPVQAAGLAHTGADAGPTWIALAVGALAAGLAMTGFAVRRRRG
ncbi:InlB B-repeat-containing protein [Mycetocola sp. JXN-3]|uniref:InlB B-repeat-containing protein n=1 Tax=Mycetocola sp. JXN-3 TaxID=2116510 RepID=UPI00165D13CF|nr:InlB B-repeat-containing protein [Mycetocola sp. JXN-3]